MTGVVIATGNNTLIRAHSQARRIGAGRSATASGQMFEIGDFLVVTAIALALIMVGFDVYRDIVAPAHWQWQDALGILQFVLILLVASIPVAMPAVFSITMALGALALVQAEGDRLEALRDRGDGGRRRALLRQDGNAHQKPTDTRSTGPVQRQNRRRGYPCRGAGSRLRTVPMRLMSAVRSAMHDPAMLAGLRAAPVRAV